MKAGKVFLLALRNPEISLEETTELNAWIRENDDLLFEHLEDLKLSRLDFAGMEKDFISIRGTRIC